MEILVIRNYKTVCDLDLSADRLVQHLYKPTNRRYYAASAMLVPNLLGVTKNLAFISMCVGFSYEMFAWYMADNTNERKRHAYEICSKYFTALIFITLFGSLPWLLPKLVEIINSTGAFTNTGAVDGFARILQ